MKIRKIKKAFNYCDYSFCPDTGTFKVLGFKHNTKATRYITTHLWLVRKYLYKLILSDIAPEILWYGKNRDRGCIWFEEIEDNPGFYTIHTDKNHEYMLQYAGCSFDELPDDAEDYDEILTYPDGRKIKVKIATFDPSGGPYMKIGSFNLQGKTLRRIINRDNLLFEFT